MRTAGEIQKEIRKVKTAKRNAERKRVRCVARLEELAEELRKAEEAGAGKEA